MPIITLDSGSLASHQKKQLIEELTRVSSDITGIPPSSFVVLINEIPDENVGVGGELLTEVKARRSSEQ